MAAAADRAQGAVEVLLELGEFVVDVDVALAAQPVGLGVRGVDQPGRLGVRGLHHVGLGDQPLLLLDAFLDRVLVGEVAALDEAVGLRLGAAGGGFVVAFGVGGEPDGLLAGFDHRALAVLACLRHHAVGLGLGLGEQPVGLGAGVAEHGLGLGAGGGDRGVGVFLGLAQQRVTGVQDILGVIEFAGNGVLDVVDQLQHVAPGNHATRRHRHPAGLLDDGAQFVERFKNSVHGPILQTRRL